MSKAVAKKPAAKKSVAKKPAAKAAVAAKASAKKPTPAKTAVKKAAAQKPAEKKTSVKVEQPVAPVAKAVPPPQTVDSAAASRDFAFSFAEMMKKANRQAEAKAQSTAQGIKLSRRPTTRTKGSDSLKFPAADLAEFKKRLLQLREAATGHSATLKNVALEQSDERVSEDEDGSDAFLRLQSLSQVDSQNRLIHKIDEALLRIEDGSYGICEVCGQLIRKPRLLNMPFVHTCMECQSEMEAPYGGR